MQTVSPQTWPDEARDHGGRADGLIVNMLSLFTVSVNGVVQSKRNKVAEPRAPVQSKDSKQMTTAYPYLLDAGPEKD